MNTIVVVVVLQGLVFIGLILILKQFMKGHVSGAVGHLHKLNEELLKQQAEVTRKLAETEKAYQAKHAQLEEEVRSKQGQARQEAAKMIEDSRQRAMQEREKIINEAIETREKMRHEIMAEMDEKAILHSGVLVGEFFRGEIQQMLHDHLFRQVLEGIRGMQPEQFQMTSEEGEIITPASLDEKSRTELVKAFREKLNHDVRFKESQDPALVAGVILKFGTLVIDGSMAHRLREAAAVLKKETARRYQGAS